MNKYLALLGLLLASVCSKELYDAKVSYVTPLNRINFKPQVLKTRETTSNVSVVHFYKSGDGVSQNIAPEFDSWTNNFQNLFKIGAVDCDENVVICEQEKIKTFPTFRIYPPTPMPIIDMEGEVEIKKLQQKAARELKSNVIEITNTNAKTFIAESPSVPKALLFTKQPKGIPLIYKGLSVQLEKKIFFGLVRSTDDILVQKYKIKKFPTLIVVKANEKKITDIYKGEEFRFPLLFKFLNVHSQTFVPDGGSSSDNAASKIWLTQVVPELSKQSANDICLQVQGALCVIHIGNKPEKEVIDTLKDLNTQYDRKIERGAIFKFMWLDASVESEYASVFKYANTDKIVVLKPGRIKKFVTHEGEFTFRSLQTTFENISGGNARFQKVQLPQFTIRKE